MKSFFVFLIVCAVMVAMSLAVEVESQMTTLEAQMIKSSPSTDTSDDKIAAVLKNIKQKAAILKDTTKHAYRKAKNSTKRAYRKAKNSTKRVYRKVKNSTKNVFSKAKKSVLNAKSAMADKVKKIISETSLGKAVNKAKKDLSKTRTIPDDVFVDVQAEPATDAIKPATKNTNAYAKKVLVVKNSDKAQILKKLVKKAAERAEDKDFANEKAAEKAAKNYKKEFAY